MLVLEWVAVLYINGKVQDPGNVQGIATCRYFNSGWGRVQSSFWHFMRLQTQFINLVNIEILPPYISSDEERADARLYAENVRR